MKTRNPGVSLKSIFVLAAMSLFLAGCHQFGHMPWGQAKKAALDSEMTDTAS